MTTSDTRKFRTRLYCARCATTTSKAHYRVGSSKVHCWKCATSRRQRIIAMIGLGVGAVVVAGAGVLVAKLKGIL